MDPKTYIHTRSQRLAANAAAKERLLDERIAQVVAAAHVAEAARLVEVCPGCRQAPCQTPRSCTIRLRAITQHRLREAELAALWPSKHELQIKLT
ncbi:MAG TPA: hypothetical protein DEF47_12290 [Herpetosiphon sp.]|uniref:Uncharacterized protein n=1 Tax=Herpetosiphon aurantiacus (strain ATCC 23779 / DSM 785 / 114-95) TaxID=316274 RepID=A9B4F0_HERA2|nr:hypothetical protein [Herpetosiphon sp.]ABX02707.1 hypothetical protein Haur_0055 [Herpetosiphon aurantiacus DSM 785]HBW50674.1 hypothetical protein [Herpetosiphon sp.]